MSKWSGKIFKKNSSQNFLSMSDPFKVQFNNFVTHLQKSSKRFVIEILTTNLMLNLSGSLFFMGLGCSLKWWYKDQLFLVLLKQNLPAFNESQQKLSWETSEYILKEQNPTFAKKALSKLKPDMQVPLSIVTITPFTNINPCGLQSREAEQHFSGGGIGAANFPAYPYPQGVGKQAEGRMPKITNYTERFLQLEKSFIDKLLPSIHLNNWPTLTYPLVESFFLLSTVHPEPGCIPSVPEGLASSIPLSKALGKDVEGKVRRMAKASIKSEGFLFCGVSTRLFSSYPYPCVNIPSLARPEGASLVTRRASLRTLPSVRKIPSEAEVSNPLKDCSASLHTAGSKPNPEGVVGCSATSQAEDMQAVHSSYSVEASPYPFGVGQHGVRESCSWQFERSTNSSFSNENNFDGSNTFYNLLKRLDLYMNHIVVNFKPPWQKQKYQRFVGLFSSPTLAKSIPRTSYHCIPEGSASPVSSKMNSANKKSVDSLSIPLPITPKGRAKQGVRSASHTEGKDALFRKSEGASLRTEGKVPSEAAYLRLTDSSEFVDKNDHLFQKKFSTYIPWKSLFPETWFKLSARNVCLLNDELAFNFLQPRAKFLSENWKFFTCFQKPIVCSLLSFNKPTSQHSYTLFLDSYNTKKANPITFLRTTILNVFSNPETPLQKMKNPLNTRYLVSRSCFLQKIGFGDKEELGVDNSFTIKLRSNYHLADLDSVILGSKLLRLRVNLGKKKFSLLKNGSLHCNKRHEKKQILQRKNQQLFFPLEFTKTMSGWQPSNNALLLNSYLDEIPYKLESTLHSVTPFIYTNAFIDNQAINNKTYGNSIDLQPNIQQIILATFLASHNNAFQQQRKGKFKEMCLPLKYSEESKDAIHKVLCKSDPLYDRINSFTTASYVPNLRHSTCGFGTRESKQVKYGSEATEGSVSPFESTSIGNQVRKNCCKENQLISCFTPLLDFKMFDNLQVAIHKHKNKVKVLKDERSLVVPTNLFYSQSESPLKCTSVADNPPAYPKGQQASSTKLLPKTSQGDYIPEGASGACSAYPSGKQAEGYAEVASSVRRGAEGGNIQETYEAIDIKQCEESETFLKKAQLLEMKQLLKQELQFLIHTLDLVFVDPSSANEHSNGKSSSRFSKDWDKKWKNLLLSKTCIRVIPNKFEFEIKGKDFVGRKSFIEKEAINPLVLLNNLGFTFNNLSSLNSPPNLLPINSDASFWMWDFPSFTKSKNLNPQNGTVRSKNNTILHLHEKNLIWEIFQKPNYEQPNYIHFLRSKKIVNVKNIKKKINLSWINHTPRNFFQQKITTIAKTDSINRADKGVHFEHKRSRLMSGYVYPDTQSQSVRKNIYQWLTKNRIGFNKETGLSSLYIWMYPFSPCISPSEIATYKNFFSFTSVLKNITADTEKNSNKKILADKFFDMVWELRSKKSIDSLIKGSLVPHFTEDPRQNKIYLLFYPESFQGVNRLLDNAYSSNIEIPITPTIFLLNFFPTCISTPSGFTSEEGNKGNSDRMQTEGKASYLRSASAVGEAGKDEPALHSIDIQKYPWCSYDTKSTVPPVFLKEVNPEGVAVQPVEEYSKSEHISPKEILLPYKKFNHRLAFFPGFVKPSQFFLTLPQILQGDCVPIPLGGSAQENALRSNNASVSKATVTTSSNMGTFDVPGLLPIPLRGKVSSTSKISRIEKFITDCNTRSTAYRGIAVQRNQLTKDLQPFKEDLRQSSTWSLLFLGPENPLTDRQCHFFGQKQLSTLDVTNVQRDYLRQLGKEIMAQTNKKGFTEKLPSIERTKILSLSKTVNSFFLKKRKYAYLLEKTDHWHLFFQEQLRAALEDTRKYPPLTTEEIKNNGLLTTGRIKISAPLIITRFPKEMSLSNLSIQQTSSPISDVSHTGNDRSKPSPTETSNFQINKYPIRENERARPQKGNLFLSSSHSSDKCEAKTEQNASTKMLPASFPGRRQGTRTPYPEGVQGYRFSKFERDNGNIDTIGISYPYPSSFVSPFRDTTTPPTKLFSSLPVSLPRTEHSTLGLRSREAEQHFSVEPEGYAFTEMNSNPLAKRGVGKDALPFRGRGSKPETKIVWYSKEKQEQVSKKIRKTPSASHLQHGMFWRPFCYDKPSRLLSPRIIDFKGYFFPPFCSPAIIYTQGQNKKLSYPQLGYQINSRIFENTKTLQSLILETDTRSPTELVEQHFSWADSPAYPYPSASQALYPEGASEAVGLGVGQQASPLPLRASLACEAGLPSGYAKDAEVSFSGVAPQSEGYPFTKMNSNPLAKRGVRKDGEGRMPKVYQRSQVQQRIYFNGGQSIKKTTYHYPLLTERQNLERTNTPWRNTTFSSLLLLRSNQTICKERDPGFFWRSWFAKSKVLLSKIWPNNRYPSSQQEKKFCCTPKVGNPGFPKKVTEGILPSPLSEVQASSAYSEGLQSRPIDLAPVPLSKAWGNGQKYRLHTEGSKPYPEGVGQQVTNALYPSAYPNPEGVGQQVHALLRGERSRGVRGLQNRESETGKRNRSMQTSFSILNVLRNVTNNLQWLIQESLTANSWVVICQWFFLIALLFWIEQMLLKNIFPALFALEQILLGTTGIKTSNRTHIIRVSKPLVSNTPKFQDLAGIDGLLGELSELVLFLRGHKERLWNKKSSYGVLLTGPPGTGKTFLVRALANEARVPVLILSAGTLVASKLNTIKPSWAIRHAFRRAKQLAPCILFIDEIDALGKSRGKIVTDSNEIIASTFSTSVSLSESEKFPVHKATFGLQGLTSTANLLYPSAYPNPEGVGQQALYPAGASEAEGLGMQSYPSSYENMQRRGNMFFSGVFSYQQSWPSVSNFLLNEWEHPLKSLILYNSKPERRDANLEFSPKSKGIQKGTKEVPTDSTLRTHSSGTFQNIDTRIHNIVENGEAGSRKFGPLTQLLVSMDGVSNLSGVLIIGATNRPEILDPALTRPGRFERIIRIEKPSEQKRIEILKLYSHNLGTQHQIPWNYLANRTRGLTAADLAVAMNYSSLKAIIQGSTHTIETIEYGLNSITRFFNKPFGHSSSMHC